MNIEFTKIYFACVTTNILVNSEVFGLENWELNTLTFLFGVKFTGKNKNRNKRGLYKQISEMILDTEKGANLRTYNFIFIRL